MSIEMIIKTMTLARQAADLAEIPLACQLYWQAVNLAPDTPPDILVEAGEYLLAHGDNYKLGYTLLVKGFAQDYAKDQIFEQLAQTFYYPNAQEMAWRYEANVKLLAQYPYIFDQTPPPFDQLQWRFFPYDENYYLPYDQQQDCFTTLENPYEPVLDRWFFQDTSKPIFVEELYNGYQLMYLSDMVRKSEWYAGDNHIYLHYASFEQFCSYLQIIDLAPLLAEEKFVFLFGEQAQMYPLDFKAQFGIDYAAMKPKPLGVREVHKLVWHMQTRTHTGGDFFNEVLDFHPNLIVAASIMHEAFDTPYRAYVEFHKKNHSDNLLIDPEYYSFVLDNQGNDENLLPGIHKRLRILKHFNRKDWVVALYLTLAELAQQPLDGRVVPAIVYQPHFGNSLSKQIINSQQTVYENNTVEILKKDSLFKQFKYIKTFATVRRPTTSLGGNYRFSYNNVMKKIQDSLDVDNIPASSILLGIRECLLNRNTEVDRTSPLFADSVAVRFEDGKLNPKATFTALCGFLDIPWADTLQTATIWGRQEVYDVHGSVTKGFELHPVYNRYEEFISEEDGYILEAVMTQRLKAFGYQCLYYDGQPYSPEQLQEMLLKEMKVWSKQKEIIVAALDKREALLAKQGKAMGEREALLNFLYSRAIAEHRSTMEKVAMALLNSDQPPLVSPEGNPLTPMPLLQPIPALLERPLYE